ncbi:MAG: replicative DNA helicase [Eubacterium sp.]
MEDTVVKKVLPHSTEAEKAVIGSMIMDKDAIEVALELISSEDFYGKQYSVLFKAMTELYDEGKAVDLITIKNKLAEDSVPDEVISMDFVREILASVPTSANVKQYAKIVYDKSMLRRAIKINDEISMECYNGGEKMENIMDDMEKKVFNLLQKRGAGEYTPIRQIVLNALDKVEAASKNAGSITGVATGFRDLDYMLSGLQPSDFILVAARPSMGKTALILNMAENIAIKKGIPVAMFSLEMSKEQLVNRLLAQHSMVDSQKIRTGKLIDEEWDKLIKSADAVGNSGIIIDDTPSISMSELRSKARKYKLEKDIQVILIDYIQLMRGNAKIDSRQQEVSEISRSLKALARELNIPIVVLSQLNRAVESRPDKRPMLSDLRESGAIEQDADVVMFIYRDDYYNKESEEKGVSEIIIAKQRNGPVGTAKLAWMPEITKFGNLQK